MVSRPLVSAHITLGSCPSRVRRKAEMAETDVARPVAWVPRPLPLSDFVGVNEKLTAEHGKDLYLREHANRFVVYTSGTVCGCSSCLDELDKFLEPSEALARFMVLCQDCGNKRCPKAAHHENGCTGSNEPGQPGSIY